MSFKMCAEQFQLLVQSHISIPVIYSLVTCTQTSVLIPWYS